MRPAAPLTEVSSAPSRTRFEFPMGRNELVFGALPDFLLRHEHLPEKYAPVDKSKKLLVGASPLRGRLKSTRYKAFKLEAQGVKINL